MEPRTFPTPPARAINSAVNFMIDFETLGQTPDTVVLSLGVAVFDRTRIIDKAYFEFSVDDQLGAGRVVSGDTIAWWMGQSEEARKIFGSRPDQQTSMREFAQAFGALASKYGDPVMWGNGANFDIAILEHMHRSQGWQMPWKFWNVACFRTLDRIFGMRKNNPWTTGVRHHALADAVYQAECLLKLWEKQPELAEHF